MLPDGHVHVAHEYRFSAAPSPPRSRKRSTARPRIAGGRPQLHRDRPLAPSIARATWARASPKPSRATTSPCQAGDNARTLGWQRLRHWLVPAPDGIPWLTIDPSCRYLRRTLPGLISDVRDPEDVNTEGDDHAADALRYGLMSRPSPTEESLANQLWSRHCRVPESARRPPPWFALLAQEAKIIMFPPALADPDRCRPAEPGSVRLQKPTPCARAHASARRRSQRPIPDSCRR